MDPNEVLLSRGVGGGNTEGFVDRSKVRILLCDNDMRSSEEVFNLLCKCSYQVTSVISPRQVIDALNADGPDIDIILSEVDLPMATGFKMLKYIMRDKNLRRIPVIMMSAQDEVALVVKCLRLGAADYLVQPLRTNELLNLWTHMWRRRRMLGLAEKNIMNCEFDLVPSDPSDANTNSTTMFSDDTDDNKSPKSSEPEISVSIPLEDESNVILDPGLVNTLHINLLDDRPNVPEINEQQRAVYPGKNMFGPKKSELRIGESSAFFTYVKSSMFTSATHGGSVIIDEPTPLLDNKLSLVGQQVDSITINLTDENATQYMHVEEKVSPCDEHVISDTQGHDHLLARDAVQKKNLLARDNINSNNSFPDSMSVDTSSTSPLLPESCQPMNPKQLGHNYHPDVSGCTPYSAYPYYLPGPVNHVMMSSIYQQYMSVPHCPPHHHMPGMTSFTYYPVNLCLPGQMPPGMHPWPSYGTSSNNNVKVHKLDRREAALLKFRQKKKERCFDKKIRYVNRKKLAERRPRVRGQFVRKINGINVDLNGKPTSTDFDEDDDDDDNGNDEEEDQAGRESSPENNYAVFHV